jgi:hypothetical protein
VLLLALVAVAWGEKQQQQEGPVRGQGASGPKSVDTSWAALQAREQAKNKDTAVRSKA